MKFGKLADVQTVDFQLPVLTEEVLSQLPGKASNAGFQALIGAPRWASKEWVGSLYPKGTRAGDYLHHYAQSFHTIELNTTHYRIPTPEMVANWAAASNADFRFCAKIPQVISHHLQLTNCQEELQAFTQAIRHFGTQLGHSFLQVHESFGPQQLNRMALFLQSWPADLPLAVELRHERAFVDHMLIPEFAELLRNHQVAAVVTDVAGRRDVWHQSFTAPVLMLRFVGNGLHPTDYARFEDWLPRLQRLAEHGLQTLYLFVHQPEDPQVFSFSQHAANRLNEVLGLNVPVPGLPAETGGQMSLF